MNQGEKVSGVDGMTLEICAGLIDKSDLSIEDHVVAEVEEETGYKGRVVNLIYLFRSPYTHLNSLNDFFETFK